MIPLSPLVSWLFLSSAITLTVVLVVLLTWAGDQ